MSLLLYVTELASMPFAQALELQRAVARARITGAIDQDVLLLVEHPHVVTLGRAARGATLTASPQLLAARGVELHEVERGGDVTYHGPGQLVGYPILDLKRHRKDLHWYLRQVEETLIVALRSWGIIGWRSAGYTGVWVGEPQGAASGPITPPPPVPAVPESRVTSHESRPFRPESPAPSPGASSAPRKIASIGVHARDWVTWHGFALNVATDLSFFDLMIPCGIYGVDMTSVSREVGARNAAVSVAQATPPVIAGFGTVFGLTPVPLPLEALVAMAAA